MRTLRCGQVWFEDTVANAGCKRRLGFFLPPTVSWQRLLGWIRQSFLAGARIDAAELALLKVTDLPEEACPAVLNSYLNTE